MVGALRSAAPQVSVYRIADPSALVNALRGTQRMRGAPVGRVAVVTALTIAPMLAAETAR